MAEVTPKKIYLQAVPFDCVYPTSGNTIPHLTKVYAEFNSLTADDYWAVSTSDSRIKSIKGYELYSVSNTEAGTVTPTWSNSASGTCWFTFKSGGATISAAKVTLLCSDMLNGDL